METLRICMPTVFYPPYHTGGDAIHVYNLANALADKGHEIEIIHCIDSYNLKTKQKARGGYPNDKNIKIHSLKSAFGRLSPISTYLTGYPLFKNKIKEILKKRFDVIHYHTTSFLGPKIFQYGNAEKIYTAHQHFLVCPLSTMFKYNRFICDKKNCLFCLLRTGKPPQFWRYTTLLDKSLQYLKFIITPSDYLKMILVENGIKNKINVLPHFTPYHKKNENGDREFFLFVGRLDYYKGLQNLIKVYNQEQDLLIAGGDGNYSKELKKIAKKQKKIKFLGKVNSNKLYNLYQKAIAVIIPSLVSDIFSMVGIEALSNGAPLIVHNIGALPEIVKKSRAGLIYNNEKELVSSLESIQYNKLRNQLSKNAAKAYKLFYSQEEYLKNYLQLIRKF